MQQHAERDRSDEVRVLPYRQSKETLVLGQRVHCVEHLNRHENRETHRRSTVRHDVGEHLTSDFREEARALVEVGLGEIQSVSLSGHV